MRCIVIDGEDFSSRSLARMLEQVGDVDLVSVARNGFEGQSIQEREQADLLLVNTSAEGLSALKQSTQNYLPQIIFVSAGRDHPEEVYNYSATDYLAQPLSESRLEKAIDRARMRIQFLAPSQPKEEVFLRHEKGLSRIKFIDIIYIKKVEGGCEVRTESESIKVDWQLRESLEKLNDQRFQKVNRDYVVNLHKVSGIHTTSVVIADKTLTISRAIRPMLERMLQNL